MTSEPFNPAEILPDRELSSVTGGADILDLNEQERRFLDADLLLAKDIMNRLFSNAPEGIQYLDQIILQLKINNIFGARMAASGLIQWMYSNDRATHAEHNPFKNIFDCLIRS